LEERYDYITSDASVISEDIFRILGKKWSLPIIKKLAKYEKLRFNQIKNNFQKITPTTLSSILKELEKHRIVKKKIHDDYLSTVSYFLTDYGIILHELSKMVETISSNSNSIPSMNKEYLRKISTVIKNFRTNTKVSKNKIRQFLLPLATLASVSSVLCTTHGIQHLKHLTSFS